MPATMETSLKTAAQEVFYNGVDIETALNAAQENIIRDMESSSFTSVESLYAYAE